MFKISTCMTTCIVTVLSLPPPPPPVMITVVIFESMQFPVLVLWDCFVQATFASMCALGYTHFQPVVQVAFHRDLDLKEACQFPQLDTLRLSLSLLIQVHANQPPLTAGEN